MGSVVADFGEQAYRLIDRLTFAVEDVASKQAESAPSASTNIASDEIADYDCGLINDYGGGNVQWWQDYLRHEINRCNEYWRSATSHVA